MKKALLALPVVLVLMFLSGSAAVLAQYGPASVVAEVSFDFSVGDKAFSAGNYKIARRGEGSTLMISAEKGGESAMIPVITRLARRNGSSDENKPILVFDRVGNTHALSEVWLPGQDGYLVKPTAEEHEHDIVGSLR